ncbi:MAG: FAD-dependent oxidoreductase [Deltaproteobacteria bacterium]|nr:FAD-dependent oxidoreductase [Deltaproteobacteria bacterium]
MRAATQKRVQTSTRTRRLVCRSMRRIARPSASEASRAHPAQDASAANGALAPSESTFERVSRGRPRTSLGDGDRDGGRDRPLDLEGLADRAREAAKIDLDAQKVRALALSSNMLSRTLSLETSPTLAALYLAFERWERTTGDAKNILMPRHLLRLPPLQKAVMDAVRKVVPGGPLPLDALGQALPAAMTRLFRSHARRRELSDLYTAVVIDGLAEMSRGYQRQVIAEGGSAFGLFVDHSLGSAERSRVHRALPEQFPLPEEKIEWAKILGDPALRAILSAVWKGQVLSGQISARRFYADHGLNDALMRALQRDHAAEFPPLQRRGAMRKSALLALTEGHAIKVGAFMRAQIEADFLVRQDEICDRWNGSPTLGRVLGTVDPDRLAKLRAAFDGRLPRMPESAEKLERLLPEVQAASKGAHDIRDLLAKMRNRHPGFKRNWLSRLRDAYGEQVPRFERKRRAPLRRNIARSSTTKTEQLVRVSLPLEKLGELVLATAPPGATAPMLNSVLDAELRARGYPGLPASHLKLSEFRFLREASPSAEGLREINSRRVAEVVAEFARAAPPGRTLPQILGDVRDAYPHIERRELNAYLRIWSAAPGRFPALSDFVRKGRLEIRALNQVIASPQYLGRWSFERWAQGASPLELARIESLTQYARLPRQLDLIDEVLATRGSPTKLGHTRMFWVTHLKADIVPLAQSFLASGLKPSDLAVVSSPYGNSEAVERTLADLGTPVTVPALSEEAYREAVRSRLDRFLADTPFPPDRAVIVLDDGGLVADTLYAEDSPYKKWWPYIRIVEQTTGGVELADHHPLQGPMIMAARGESKEYESKLIASAVVQKISRRIEARAGEVKGNNVTVVGGGFIGRATALHLVEQGWNVTLVERNETRANEVRAASGGKVQLATLEAALPTADLVIGASSGGTSLPMPALRLLKDGAVIASASSRRREFDMIGLTEGADQREVLPDAFPRALLPDARYRLGGKWITVLGDGWPINHDADVEGIPPKRFQITDAVLLAGVFQASELGPGIKGPVPFDPIVDAAILGSYRRMEEEGRLGEMVTFDPRLYLGIAGRIAAAFPTPAPRKARADAGRIIAAVAKDFGFTPEEMIDGKDRGRSAARGIAVHLVRKHAGVSLSELRPLFGGRDNSTLIYADRQSAERMRRDPRLEARVERLVAGLHG